MKLNIDAAYFSFCSLSPSTADPIKMPIGIRDTNLANLQILQFYVRFYYDQQRKQFLAKIPEQTLVMHFSIAAISKTVEALPADTLVYLNWQLVHLTVGCKKASRHLTRVQNLFSFQFPQGQLDVKLWQQNSLNNLWSA